MLASSAFHVAVLARNSSSESDLNCSSSSLIRRTSGCIRRISRWFFEPKIFLRTQVTMRGFSRARTIGSEGEIATAFLQPNARYGSEVLCHPEQSRRISQIGRAHV